MDNLTHTLIGVLVGETANALATSRDGGLSESQRRNLCLPVMVVGSNFPDLDFLYSTISGNKLDYLLEHRGHTHTIVGAVLIAALLFAFCELWMRIARQTPRRADRVWLGVMALLGPLLHIAMDATNSYGVHPFWPLSNEWFYGDAVFIIEPALWVAAAPLAFRLRSVLARALVWLVLFAGIALSITTGLVPRPFTIGLTLLTGSMLVVSWRMTARSSLLAGIALWISATVAFAIASSVAARRVDALAQRLLPEWHTLDHVLTPMPANPLCWSVVWIQSREAQYALRRSMLSLAPDFLPAHRCPSRNPSMKITAPLVPSSVPDADDIAWHGELTMERSDLVRAVHEHCEASALMKFARAPYVARLAGQWTMGDLRFDGEPGLSFAEVALDPAQARCPAYVPPWREPRAELLRGLTPAGEPSATSN